MDTSFGYLLKEARIKKKKTLRALAKDVGVSPMYLCQIENEERIPMKGDVLSTIALALDLDPNVIMNSALKTKQEKEKRQIDEEKDEYLLIARKIKNASPDVRKRVNEILEGTGGELEAD